MVAAAILLLASLGLVHAFTTAGLASRRSDHDESARRSLESVADSICTLPWSQLLSHDGERRDFGDHSVVVSALAATPRLILVECAAVDDVTQEVLARVATWRAAEG